MRQELVLKFRYNDNNKLKEVIKNSYFEVNSRGKLGVPHMVKLLKDDILYEILDGLKSVVKIKNENLISGTMSFDVLQIGDVINLVPISKYCIKDIEDKYSFY